MDVRYNFINKHYLNDEVDAVFRAPASREPVFAFAHDFGPSTSGSVLNTIGAAQVPIMRYLTTAGIQSLLPWWTKCYGDIFQTIAFHYNDFATSQVLGAQFESQLKADVDAYYSANAAMVYSNSTPSPPPVWSNGTDSMIDTDQYGNQYIFDPDNAYGFLNPLNWSGIAVPDVQEAEAYYSIVALSARQVMGAYVLAIPPAGEDQSEPLMFQKEISSDGNVNTIDVVYPAMPFFLYANPNMLRYTLNPLYYNQENNFYPNGYSMHDLGSNFPVSNLEVQTSIISSSKAISVLKHNLVGASIENLWRFHVMKWKLGSFAPGYFLSVTLCFPNHFEVRLGNITDFMSLTLECHRTCRRE